MLGSDSCAVNFTTTNFMDENEPAWLRDEHRVILYAIVSLVVVVGGHRGWQEYNRYQEKALRRARILRMVESSKRKDRVDGKVDAPEIQLKLEEPPSSANDIDNEPSGSKVAEEPVVENPDVEIGRSKRSKERRKRGRDVYKEVIKQEKLSKSSRSLESSTDSRKASLYSRSPSSVRSVVDDRAGETPKGVTKDRFTPAGQIRKGSSSSTTTPRTVEQVENDAKPQVEEKNEVINQTELDRTPVMDESQPILDEAPPTVETPQTQDNSSTPLAAVPDEGVAESSQSGASSVASTSTSSSRDASLPREVSSVTIPAEAKAISDSSAPLYTSSPKLMTTPPTDRLWSEEPVPRRPYPPSSRASTSSLATSDGSWEFETQSQSSSSNFRRSPPPRFRSRSRASASPMPMSSISSAESNFLTTTPPSNSTLTTQIASYKGALEAARQREEKYKQELENKTKEFELLRWRWNEDTTAWQRREAEMQNRIHHLSHQLHSLNVAVASPSVPQAFMPQGSQPNLHAFGMLPNLSIPSPLSSYASPSGHSNPGQNPYAFLPPIIHTNSHSRTGGVGSSLTSPARDVHVDGSLDDSDDNFNNELAEAIFKRPESIRRPSSSASSAPRSLAVPGRATKDVVTFPSLSELGNPQRARKDEILKEGDENSQDKLSVVNGTMPDLANRYDGESPSGGNG